MIALLRGFVLGTALMTAGTVLAQEEQPAAEAPAEQPANSGISLGETIVDGRVVGEEYVKEQHGDWLVRCLTTAEGKDPCQLYQVARNAEGIEVSEITLFPLNNGGQAVAGATVITPLETLLTQQVTFQVDSGPARRYPFSFCTQVGCVARIGFTAQDIQNMKRGAQGRLIIAAASAPDEPIALPVSLTGFTAGYDALTAE